MSVISILLNDYVYIYVLYLLLLSLLLSLKANQAKVKTKYRSNNSGGVECRALKNGAFVVLDVVFPAISVDEWQGGTHSGTQ